MIILNFLIIEYLKKNEKDPYLTRSINVIDGEMSLKMLFLTYNEDIIQNLSGESHSIGDLITKIDIKCRIINNGKLIDSETKYVTCRIY